MRLVRSYFHMCIFIFALNVIAILLLKVTCPMMSVLLQQEQEVCCILKLLNNMLINIFTV